MKILGIAALLIVSSQPLAIGADVSKSMPDAGATIDGVARPAAERIQPGVNLIAFVGELFRVMKEGYLMARGVFRHPAP